MAKPELSELHLKKTERPGYAKVTVTHLPTGTVVTKEATNRREAKHAAYVEMARLLGAEPPPPLEVLDGAQ